MVPGIRPQNLNDTFLAAARQARQKLPELAHNQKVRACVRACERTPCCAFPYRRDSGRDHGDALQAIVRELQGHIVIIPFANGLTGFLLMFLFLFGCFFFPFQIARWPTCTAIRCGAF
jgi:hypothetical protein